MLLNNEWVKNEIRGEIKKFLEPNENELTTIQNSRDTAKAVLKGKFTAIQAYLKKKKKHIFQINNLTLSLQELRSKNKDSPNSKYKEGNNQDQRTIE